MQPGLQGNLIAGEDMPSITGGRLPVREALAPHGELGSWPTSGPRDVEEVLRVLEPPRGLGPVRELLAAGRSACSADREGLRLLARRIGLRPEEEELLRPRHAGGGLPRGPSGGEHIPGDVAVLVAHWSTLLAGPLLDACTELARGRALLLVSDPRAPMAAGTVARALLAARPLEDSIAVLHGLTQEGMRALLASPRVASLRGSGEPEAVRQLRLVSHESRVPRVQLRLLRSGAAEVCEGEDLGTAARDVLGDAFSRVGSLSGQAPGAVGRLYCAQRVFSAFTDALMEAFDASPDVADPLPLVDRDAANRFWLGCRSGLDQGATLIAGGTSAGGTGTGETGEGGPPRGGRGSLHFTPTVFTNVEPSQAIARRQVPMPILSLLRTPGGR